MNKKHKKGLSYYNHELKDIVIKKNELPKTYGSLRVGGLYRSHKIYPGGEHVYAMIVSVQMFTIWDRETMQYQPRYKIEFLRDEKLIPWSGPLDIWEEAFELVQ